VTVLDWDHRVAVIGEVGQAHDGSLGTAHAFIDAIADSGADAVKFQTHIAAAESRTDEPWRVKFSYCDDTRYEYWKRMEFTPQAWDGLRQHAQDRGLVFVSSPFSLEAVELLRRVGVAAWKVASGEVANPQLLDAVAQAGQPVLLSSGMSGWFELDAAVARLRAAGAGPLAVLQCTSAYPVAPQRVGLNVLGEIQQRYGCVAGLSDHSGTIFPALATLIPIVFRGTVTGVHLLARDLSAIRHAEDVVAHQNERLRELYLVAAAANATAENQISATIDAGCRLLHLDAGALYDAEADRNIAVAGAAIAVAASSGGPVPPRKSVARAAHDALAAPTVAGISAQVTFTNHLVSSSELQGSDPLLNGASGRLWVSPGHGLRLELQTDNGDAQVVVNDRSFWAYDPSSRSVYEGSVPTQAGKRPRSKQGGQGEKPPSVSEIQSDLNRAAQHLSISGAIPGDVAGQPAYTVRVSPSHDGGLLGAAKLAWDAGHGVPLRFAVYARGDSSPVLELKVTGISYGRVASSTFSVLPPSRAKVVKVAAPANGAAADRPRNGHPNNRRAEVTGVGAVAQRVPFTLLAPQKLVGVPRQSVTLLDWGGSPAALVSYGQHLGGIAVIEQTARSAQQQQSSSAQQGGQGRGRSGLNLPSVSINGKSGQELDTALGTVVRFTRNGVTYTVLGSVPPAAAEAAARAL